MKHRILLLSLAGLIFITAQANASDFKWEPGTVSAVVKIDEFRPEMGQYLYIGHDTGGEEEWNMAKLNLPEAWKIKTVTVAGHNIRVTTSNAGEFTITPDNLGKLWSTLR